MQTEGIARPARPDTSSKRCPRCDQTKPRAAFYQRRNGHLSSYCRGCQRAATQASYQRRRQDPAALALMRARDRRRKRQARALTKDGES